MVMFLFESFEALGQQVVSPAGKNIQTNDLQINFTVGQLVNSTSTTGNIIATQGFHQSFAEKVAVLATPEIPVNFTTYPNPTREVLTISTENASPINYAFYDLKGVKVANGSFRNIIQLDISAHAKGIYQLILTNDQQQLLDTFKVWFK